MLLQLANAFVHRRGRHPDPGRDVGVRGPRVPLQRGDDVEVPLVEHAVIIGEPPDGAAETRRGGRSSTDAADCAGDGSAIAFPPRGAPPRIGRGEESMSRRHMPSGPSPVRADPLGRRGRSSTAVSRRLVVLRRVDELAFSRSVAGVAPAIRRARAAESYANRVVAWDADRRPDPRTVEGRAAAVATRCPPSRRRGRVRRGDGRASVLPVDLAGRGGGSAPGARGARRSRREIETWLRAFGDAGVDGLPVGPPASALLADAVLAAGDDAIRATGAAHVRWVDDVAIFAPDRPVADVRRSMRSAGRGRRSAWRFTTGRPSFLDGRDGIARLGTAISPAASSSLR